MTADSPASRDDLTTPVGARTSCPECGVQLDTMTATCGACGAVVTGGAMDAERMERVRQRLQQGIGDGYQLGGMLGRGGMGIIFQARELSLDRDVAQKVLAFEPLLSPHAYARSEREAKRAARLDHPNIMPIFAVGQGNGIACYTMRMVRGGSAGALVTGGQALPMTRATADTIADMERRLQTQIEETRRIALAGDRRADWLAELNESLGAGAPAAGNPGQAPAGEPPHAHLCVVARGGAAQVVLGRQVKGDNAPAAYQIAPGRHRIFVRGRQEFVPAETTVVLAASDTRSVIFRTRRVAAADGARRGMRPTHVPGVSALPPGAIITENAPPDAAALIVKNPSTGRATVNWPAVRRRPGFDPRSVDQRNLSATQRAGLRRFQQMQDSVRRATTPLPAWKPQR